MTIQSLQPSISLFIHSCQRKKDMESIPVTRWNWWLPLALATLFITLTTRLIVVLLFYVGKPLPSSSIRRHLTTLIVLGSGGHTAEMLNLVAVLNKDRFCPRWYIAAATDNMSLARAKVAEESGMEKAEGRMLQGSKYMQIYRSREVGQSYLTSIGTTLVAMVHALWLILKIRPDVILCNGPGTCMPLCIAGFFLKVLGVKRVTIFYVESIARVRKLSLSGLLLYKLHLADQLFVQWPQLKQKYPKAYYVGRLM